MIDCELLVYNKVAPIMREKHPGIFVAGDAQAVPATFPAFLLWEDDNYSDADSNDFQKVDHAAWVVYVGEVYSNLVSGRKAQARTIMNTADEVMLSLGFVRMMNSPIPNTDSKIARRVAKWRAKISDELIVYQK